MKVDRPKVKTEDRHRPSYKKRRLCRILAILFVIFALLIWSLPYVASTTAVRKIVEKTVDFIIFGHIKIDEISLRWTEPCRISGIKVHDTSGREILQINSVICSQGLWQILTSPNDFGKIKISNPKINLYMSKDGEISLIHTFSRLKPSKKPISKLIGRIEMINGTIYLHRYDGKIYCMRGIDGEFDLKIPNQASGRISWASATAYDLTIDRSEIGFRYHDKRIDIPLSVIPASGGKFRIAGIVDMHSATPMLQITKPLQLMENIPINVDFGNDFISRIIAVFYNVDRLTGRVSLMVSDLLLPIGKEILHTGKGQGRLILKDVKVQISGLLSELIKLGGAVPQGLTSMKVSDLDFKINNGKVYYDDLSIITANVFEMRFSGWVGFDDRIDMRVSLPVIPRELERLLAKASPGKVLDKAGLGMISEIWGTVPVLGKRMTEIRIVGTRSEPRLALSEILKPLFKPAVPIPSIPLLR